MGIPAPASAGVLDPGFGTRGQAVENFSDDDFGPFAGLIRLPTGQLVGIGSRDNRVHYVRFSSRGALERDGFEPIPGAADLEAEAAVKAPDGSIFITGEGIATNSSTPSAPALSRLLPNGMVDSTFGRGGMALLAGHPEVRDATAIAIDSGKLVVGGRAVVNGEWRLVLARFNADGTPDPSFGGGGLMELAMTGTREAVKPPQSAYANRTGVGALLIQPDGRIVAVGTAVRADTGRAVVAAVRLTSDGQLDPTFGFGGTTTFAFGREGCGNGCRRDVLSAGRAAVLQDDRIGIAGSAGPGTDADFYDGLRAGFGLARLTPAGLLDPGFARRGVEIVGFGQGGGARTLVSTSGDGLVAAGAAPGAMAVARLRRDGTPDRSFGALGRACTSFEDLYPAPAVAEGLVTAPGGRVVGAAQDGAGGGSFMLLAAFRARSATSIQCAAVSAPSRRRAVISAVIARAGRLYVRVRNGATGRTLGFVALGRHRAGPVAIGWDLRVGGRRLRPAADYSYDIRLFERRGRRTTSVSAGELNLPTS